MRRRSRSKRLSSKFLFFAAVIAVAAFVGTTKSQPRNPWLKKYPVHVAEYDLKDKQLEFSPALSLGKNEQFEDMLKRLKPVGAINGTFYDPEYRVLGDVVIGGKLVNRGGQRHAIAITKDGKVKFLHRGRRSFDWTGIKSGIASGPLLVKAGKVAVDPVSDGFSKHSVNLRAWRSAVGATKDDKLLFVCVEQGITFSEMAHIMVALGSVDAINLDGGGATGLCDRGKIIVHPALPMTNILIIKKR